MKRLELVDDIYKMSYSGEGKITDEQFIIEGIGCLESPSSTYNGMFTNGQRHGFGTLTQTFEDCL
jgi:hypothetical protein